MTAKIHAHKVGSEWTLCGRRIESGPLPVGREIDEEKFCGMCIRTLRSEFQDEIEEIQEE